MKDSNNNLEHSEIKERIYTHLSDALKILDERRKDKDLVSKIEGVLGQDIPEVLKKEKCGVLFRQIATPNKESRMFVSITRHNNLKSVFFEYLEDKFTSNNEFKHSLGKLKVFFGFGKKGGHITKYPSVINFNESNGLKLKDVKTADGKSLYDFHKEIFNRYKDSQQIEFLDASGWYDSHGGDASTYYTHFLMLFVAHGILFENFLFNEKEGDFTQKVVLPALENVEKIIGLKPIIVPLVPFDIEEDENWYWIHHDVVEDKYFKN